MYLEIVPIYCSIQKNTRGDTGGNKHPAFCFIELYIGTIFQLQPYFISLLLTTLQRSTLCMLKKYFYSLIKMSK